MELNSNKPSDPFADFVYGTIFMGQPVALMHALSCACLYVAVRVLDKSDAYNSDWVSAMFITIPLTASLFSLMLVLSTDYKKASVFLMSLGGMSLLLGMISPWIGLFA